MPQSQSRADLPKVGERRPEQGPAQVLHAARAACPTLRADRALDHLHVAIAPLLDTLVEVDQPLGHESRVRILAIRGDEDVLDPSVGERGVGRYRVAPLDEVAEV